MFQCKFDFTEEDMVAGTLATMKKQPQKARKVLLWLIPVFIIMYTGFLISDIIDGVDIVLDILLLAVLVATYLLMWFLPKLYRSIAKRSYNNNSLQGQQCDIFMDEKECCVSFLKDGRELSKEVLFWQELTNLVEDEKYIILMFKIKFVVIKKEFLRGEKDLLVIMLNKYLDDNMKKIGP